MAKYIDVAYKNADAIVAVSETYVKRAKKVNNTAPTLSVFLGSDAKRFFYARDRYINKYPEFTIGYIGTLSFSYDIDCVIDAINILNKSKKYPQIHFLVMGSGPLKAKFEHHALEVGVNCEFTGRLPYEEMVGRLCKCDILVNPITKRSAASIINKVGDYALAGLPVVNTQECEEYRQLLESYGCGINCMSGDYLDMANAITTLILNPELRHQMGQNALKLGCDKFNRKTSYLQIVKLLDNLTD